jgi:hypothetical protein
VDPVPYPLLIIKSGSAGNGTGISGSVTRNSNHWDTEAVPIFLLLSLIIFRQLRICLCGAPSLTRSRVCSFQFFLGIASAAFLRSESHGTHEHSLLSLVLGLPQQPGLSVTSHFYVQVLHWKRRDKWQGQWFLHHDNTPSHTSLVVSSSNPRTLRI